MGRKLATKTALFLALPFFLFSQYQENNDSLSDSEEYSGILTLPPLEEYFPDGIEISESCPYEEDSEEETPVIISEEMLGQIIMDPTPEGREEEEKDDGIEEQVHYSYDCCCDCCPPKDPCAKCAQLWPSCGPEWMITPGAGPCVACGCDIFITAEFIYWAVRQDHLGFVASLPSDLTNVNSFNRGKILHPRWSIEPGFRVGIGWVSCFDGWDFTFNYTWLRPRTKTRKATPDTNFTLEDAFFTFGNLITEETNPIVITEETGKWRLNFNVIDFEWGRNFYISQCLYLRPHFGLKGTWQDQHFKATALATQEVSSQTLDLSALGKHRIDWWGIGPRAGLESAWHFTKCFSILGEVAATALWGKFESKSFITQTDLTNEVTTLIPQGSFKTEWHTVKPVLEFLLGIRWEDWWCCDQFYTSLDVGWEVQWWSGQNQFAYYLTETRWGDLGLQGLTIRTRFQF